MDKFSRQQIGDFVLFLAENRTWHDMQIVSKEIICMNCLILLFFGNSKKAISECCPLIFFYQARLLKLTHSIAVKSEGQDYLYICAVGSTSDCRSRVRKFESQLSYIIFEEIDHEIISAVIFPILLIQEGVVSYWRKYVHKVLVNCLKDEACPGKSVSKLTDWLNMTSALLIGA